MGRLSYTVGLALLSACFVATSPWIQWAAIATYAVHVLTGVVRALRASKWWSAVSLASLYSSQAATIPIVLLILLDRRDELIVWLVVSLVGLAVNFVCRAVAWVNGVSIVRWYPDRGELRDFVYFSWLGSVEA